MLQQTREDRHARPPSAKADQLPPGVQAILVTTLAEAPGLLAAALLIDTKGRRWTLRAGLALCAAALGALIADPPRAGQLALLFVARGCIEGKRRRAASVVPACRAGWPACQT